MKFSLDEQKALYDAYNITPFLKVSSPFRDDKKPSFSTYEKKGVLYWKDFGTNDSGDVLDLISMIEGIGFKDAVFLANKILSDTTITRRAPEPAPVQDRKVFSDPQLSDFELAYWERRGVQSEQLRAERVESLKMLSVNDKFVATSTVDNPRFVYRYGEDSYKIYSPFDTQYKWISNNINTPFETGAVSKYPDLFILSSKKDRMVFDNLGIPVSTVSLHSEGNFNPLIKELEEGDSLSRYSKMFSFLDFDEAGHNAMQSIFQRSKGRILPLEVPEDVRFFLNGLGIKDLDDMYVKMGGNKLSEFIFKLLKKKIC